MDFGLDIDTLFIILYVSSIILFFVIFGISMFVRNKIVNSDSKYFRLTEYFPEDEIHSLRQIWYLIVLMILFLTVFNSLFINSNDIYVFIGLDVLISVYLCMTVKVPPYKNIILIIMLIPVGAIDLLWTRGSTVGIFDIFHVIACLYFMRIYYRKFIDYTENNGLGITILLLGVLIFVSFILTSIIESVSTIDALVMVSNAFTSNGYAVLGSTDLGKINSLFLVWGGYILSGVGTATLTAAILTKHFNKRFNELEELIKKNNED